MTIKIQRPIQIVNNCDCVVDEGELIKAILWYSSKPIARVKTVYVYGKYPAVSIYNEKIHIHRLLMMYWLNRKLSSEEYVHHKDENQLNALRRNLEIVGQSKHQSQHNKGRKQTVDHIKKRINSTTLTRYGHIVYESPSLLE